MLRLLVLAILFIHQGSSKGVPPPHEDNLNQAVQKKQPHEYQDQPKKFEDLVEKFQDQQETIHDLQEKFQDLQEKIQDQQQKIQDPQAKVQDHPEKLRDVVAFSADLSENKELVGGVAIVYDRVTVNAGGLYINTSGQFICEDTSLYVFLWTLMKGPEDEIPGMRCISELSSRGVSRKYGPKTSYESTFTSGVAEMTTIARCATLPFTAVTVQTVPWSQDAGSNAVFRGQYTTFSGFRLQESIAFAAELSQNLNLFPDDRIRFDEVLTNLGGHYNSQTHEFVCPDNGLYVFSVTTQTPQSATPWTVSRLMMQGKVVVEGPITYVATPEHDSGSASITVVLQCTQNYTIYVEAQNAHNFPYNSYGARLTSFTGYKLYNIVDSVVAFSAVMTQNHTTQYEPHPLMFDKVLTNVGSGFNVTSSYFICPDNDYYLFTWGSTLDDGGLNSQLDLNMAGTLVQPLIFQTSEGIETTGSSSISEVVQCVTGQRLRVQSRLLGDKIYLGNYTTFSGFKIPGELY